MTNGRGIVKISDDEIHGETFLLFRMRFPWVLIDSLRFLLLLIRSADVIWTNYLGFGFDILKILILYRYRTTSSVDIKTKQSSHPALVDLFPQLIASSFYHQEHN